MHETSEHRVLYVCWSTEEPSGALLSVLEMQGFRITVATFTSQGPAPDPAAFSAVIVDTCDGASAHSLGAYLADAQSAGVPSIVLSPSEALQALSAKAGAGFLMKPVNWQALVLKLLRLAPAAPRLRDSVEAPGSWSSAA